MQLGDRDARNLLLLEGGIDLIDPKQAVLGSRQHRPLQQERSPVYNVESSL